MGALTVAGQWRIFTAFPSILAIAGLMRPQPRGCGTGCNHVMEAISMT